MEHDAKVAAGLLSADRAGPMMEGDSDSYSSDDEEVKTPNNKVAPSPDPASLSGSSSPKSSKQGRDVAVAERIASKPRLEVSPTPPEDEGHDGGDQLGSLSPLKGFPGGVGTYDLGDLHSPSHPAWGMLGTLKEEESLRNSQLLPDRASQLLRESKMMQESKRLLSIQKSPNVPDVAEDVEVVDSGPQAGGRVSTEAPVVEQHKSTLTSLSSTSSLPRGDSVMSLARVDSVLSTTEGGGGEEGGPLFRGDSTMSTVSLLNHNEGEEQTRLVRGDSVMSMDPGDSSVDSKTISGLTQASILPSEGATSLTNSPTDTQHRKKPHVRKVSAHAVHTERVRKTSVHRKASIQSASRRNSIGKGSVTPHRKTSIQSANGLRKMSINQHGIPVSLDGMGDAPSRGAGRRNSVQVGVQIAKDVGKLAKKDTSYRFMLISMIHSLATIVVAIIKIGTRDQIGSQITVTTLFWISGGALW